MLKKALLIGIPLIALICAGVAVVMLGIVKLPFLKFEKPTAKTGAKDSKKPEAKTPAAPAPKPVAVKKLTPKPKPKPVIKPAPTSDPAKGATRVAKVWNQLEPEALVKVAGTWPDPELAAVLVKMEDRKVAGLLAALPPAKASSVSQAIRKEASKLPLAPSP